MASTLSSTVDMTAGTPIGRLDLPQYSLRQILAVWLAATVPMSILSWGIAPWLSDRIGGRDPFLDALLICFNVGLIWMIVLVLILVLVRREQGSLSWSHMRDALWLRTPRDSKSGHVGGRVWWWVLPFTLPYTAYLRERWTAGCHNASALWRDVRAQGFTGELSAFRSHLARWRTPNPRQVPKSIAPVARPVSVRQATWLLMKDAADLDLSERAYVDVLCRRCPEADRTRSLAQVFGALVRARDQAALAPWLEQAEQSGVAELRGFATGLRRDGAAVEAALRLTWSNCQTEGQITKLNSVSSDGLSRGSVTWSTARSCSSNRPALSGRSWLLRKPRNMIEPQGCAATFTSVPGRGLRHCGLRL